VGAREGSYAVVIITVPRGRPGGIRERAGAECGNAAVLSSSRAPQSHRAPHAAGASRSPTELTARIP